MEKTRAGLESNTGKAKAQLGRARPCTQLQPADRHWVRGDLRRGCVHLHDPHSTTILRPVLCTLDCTAGDVAQRLSRLSSKSGAVVRMAGKDSTGSDHHLSRGLSPPLQEPSPCDTSRDVHGLKLRLMEDRHSQGDSNSNPLTPDSECLDRSLATPDGDPDGYGGLTSGSDIDDGKLRDHRDSLNDDMLLGTDASILSPVFDSAPEGLDAFGSSSDELELDGPSLGGHEVLTSLDTPPSTTTNIHINGMCRKTHSSLDGPVSAQDVDGSSEVPNKGKNGLQPVYENGTNSPQMSAAAAVIKPDQKLCPASERNASSPTLYVQLHGETVRQLEPDEKPLQIQNEFLFKLGFKDPWRVQEEGMDSEIGSLIRFYAGKPYSIESSERIQLCGTYNVRKGKMQLPVNRWTRRQVILCGTCLIVSSVKDSQAGKMHILPLMGGKVEEVRKHTHCLAFSSSGPQSQTYYISFDSFTEHLRWQRQASKVVSQRISSVDLSCCSLEHLPRNLFYSQDLTHLNLKHNFLQASRGLAELQRFSKLRSLNLSNNHLGHFPLAVCDIPTLTELNVSCNFLTCVPSAVGTMLNLQTFLLDGNCLQSLPLELGALPELSYLGLSFNELAEVPLVLERLAAMERLCMSGNNLSQLTLQAFRLLRVKHMDLRLNKICRVIPDEPDFLRHVTHLDLRDNRLLELDATLFPRLEVLHCERNRLRSLRVRGNQLKSLHVSNNELCDLYVSPVPCNLTMMDISRNRLEMLPEWVCESKKLEVLDVSHNLLGQLPERLLMGSSLRKLLVGHNLLQRVPEKLDGTQIEVLDVQHNQLCELPAELFLKASSLRCLNASANRLENVPPSSLCEESRSTLQELYLTNNQLTDKCVALLTGHGRLRVLHMAYNQLQTFPASKMAKLEDLEEVDLSGNRLKAIPTTILNCKRMHTVIAHSNCIEVFPEVMQLTEMKCVDLSCNELGEITLPESLPAKLQELDLTGNPRLALDHKTLEQLNNIRCFRIDQSPTSFSASEAPAAPAVWSHGYTEASGVKNKLCVAALSVSSFGESREALFGVFDGDRNVEVPYLLQCTMSDVLAEELHRSKSEEEHMTNTFLVMQRKLGTAGQKLGGSAALCHIKHDPLDPGGCFTLTAANVGKCQAILCRDGKPLSLSVLHNVGLEEEYRRVRQHKAIVTEDNKVNGVTDSTRIMGYSFLYPSVIPRPHVQTVTLTPQDEFFILGSRGLWESVSAVEAVEAVRNVPDALAAAKKLCSLAQGYGCGESLSAVVVQLNVAEDCCCCCCESGPGSSAAPFLPSSVGAGMRDALATPSSCSELSSEVSTSEMSSEVGSTASDEPVQSAILLHETHPGPSGPPETRCALHPGTLAGSFQRQLSSATFSSALSDNGLDSEDEEPIAGVFSNGSRVEVEADVHFLHVHGPLTTQTPMPESVDEGGVASDGRTLSRRWGNNGSVAPQERIHNLIEVAADAPARKPGGYFTAPAQPDPDDQFIIPPELEEEVKEIMKQHQQEQQQQQKLHPSDQPGDAYDTPL